MNESTILLSPGPGIKPEFLATVTPVKTNGDCLLPFEIVLNGYSRETWAMEPNPSSGWKEIILKSVDGRGKIPGFLKYLKERKKAAYGKFENDSTDKPMKSILVVPPNQPKQPNQPNQESDGMICHILLDSTQLHPPKKKPVIKSSVHAKPQMIKHPKPEKKVKKTTTRKSNGILGNLFKANQKTEKHLASVPKSSVVKTSSHTLTSDDNGSPTSGSVIAKFRQDVEQKLLDFQQDPNTNMVKIRGSLASITKDLSNEQKGNVTMDVIKYIVYEQAEEIGEDKWIAAKEPSEFMDELCIAVYKEGHAPAEVLEDINKGDMPDEIRGQQRALHEANLKMMARKEEKQDRVRQQQAIKHNASASDGMLTELNTNKRDRRSIEEIQRDMIKK